MSRLLVITRHALVPGFHLAGVEAFGVRNAAEAQALMTTWLENAESALLAVDFDILAAIDPTFMRRLNTAERLPVIPIPGGISLSQPAFRQQHIADMIRQAVGIHITFKGQQHE